MSLKVILEEINAALPVEWQKLFGDEQVAYEGRPPRLTWVPLDEGIAPIQRRAGEPGALWVRRPTIVAHLWAVAPDPNGTALEHVAAAEAMLGELVHVVHSLLTHGSYRLERPAEWNVARGVVRFGVVYLLPITFLVPITRAAPVPAVIAGTATSTTIVNPGTGAEQAGPTITQ